MVIQNAKKHFEVLDGLRGVAALTVVIFHFMEIVISEYSHDLFGHGFLAVDFFFCLSGFVMAYAYDDRIGIMGLKKFSGARLIRLHPLVILGSVLGLLAFLFDPFSGPPLTTGLFNITQLFIGSLLMIPLPAMPDRYYNLFGFNPPAWSLFWEYIANLIYAFILSRIKSRRLALLLIPAAMAICYVAQKEGSLLGGWSGPTFWDGFVRMAWSFLAGLLIYRFGWIRKNNLGFLGLSLLLLAALLSPYSKWNWLSEPAIVLIYFPLLVILGAGATPGPRMKKLCTLSGKISYPLYMTHYWALSIFGNYFNRYHPDPIQLLIIIPLAIIFLLALAYLAMIAYDIPLRRKLAR